VRRFTDELTILAGAIEAGDSKAILDTFERAKTARDAYCENSC
jgi:prephenate dehydrogenase